MAQMTHIAKAGLALCMFFVAWEKFYSFVWAALMSWGFGRGAGLNIAGFNLKDAWLIFEWVAKTGAFKACAVKALTPATPFLAEATDMIPPLVTEVTMSGTAIWTPAYLICSPLIWGRFWAMSYIAPSMLALVFAKLVWIRLPILFRLKI